MLTVESASVTLAGAALTVGLLIHLVWMGLALGAVLKKLDAPAVQAWIPVLRWIAAARVGRTSTMAVAISRGAALFGGLLAVGALVTSLLTESPDVDNAVLVVALSGTLVWLAGSVTGWVLWIYGAGTIQMRMRAPRGLTWIAAFWPVIWASIMGWGKYRVYGGGVAAMGMQAPATQAAAVAAAPAASPALVTSPSSPLPVRQQLEPSARSAAPTAASASVPATPEPTPARVSPFAALAPEQLRPDLVDPTPASPPAPTHDATPPVSVPAPEPVGEPEPVPVREPEPDPAAAPTAPPADVSPYVAKLSPYLATPDEAPPSSASPYVTPPPTQPSAPDPRPVAPSASPEGGPSNPASPADAAPAPSLDSWVERMRQANASAPEPVQPETIQAEPTQPEPTQPEPATAPTFPTPAPLINAPDTPSQTQAEPVAPEHVEPATAPSPVAPAPTPATPTPATPIPAPPTPAPPAPTPPQGQPEEHPTGASALPPVITPPPPAPTPPQPVIAPVPEADDDDDNTVVVRRASKSWALKVGNASYAIGDTSVVVGRATATSRPGILGIADTTKTMSKRHAELIRRGDSWWVRDLGSTNGTYIRAADGSERRIEGSDSQIVDGDLVLGDLVAIIATTEAN